MKIWHYIFVALCLHVLPASASAERVYTFGIVPQQPSATLIKTWEPVLQWLSARSGVKLGFATGADIPAFEQQVATGAYDFAYMNPYHFTVYNQSPGYHALARAKGETITGILVVHKDDPIRSMQKLSNVTVVFPSPAAFAASLLVRAELRRNGVQFTPKYVHSHNSVYMNVAQKFFPAGGGVPRTFGLLAPKYRDNLRVLWQSRPYTSHAIAYRPDMPAAVVQRVREAMAAMNRNPEGLNLLKAIGFTGFEPAVDADWDDIRDLGIQPEDAQIVMESN